MQIVKLFICFIIFLLIQTLPCLEQGLETPSSCSQIRKVLDFETPEIPPYVTVRKKKPLPKCDFMGDTLHTTVIESANFPISDCQGWKRLESTHIDHVAEAFGHMTLLTNDISAIHTGYSLSEATEALINSTNPKYGSSFFVEVQVKC